MPAIRDHPQACLQDTTPAKPRAGLGLDSAPQAALDCDLEVQEECHSSETQGPRAGAYIQQTLLPTDPTARRAAGTPGGHYCLGLSFTGLLAALMYVSAPGLGSTASAGGEAGSSHSPKPAPPAQT